MLLLRSEFRGCSRAASVHYQIQCTNQSCVINHQSSAICHLSICLLSSVICNLSSFISLLLITLTRAQSIASRSAALRARLRDWSLVRVTSTKSLAEILSRDVSFCDIVATRKGYFNTITLTMTLAINPTLVH